MNPRYTFKLQSRIAYPLVKKFYKSSNYYSNINRDDLVYVSENGSQETIAAVRLIPTENNTFLMRSFVVAADYRRQGLGHRFLNWITEQLDHATCWCYPYSHLKSFYNKSGFIVVEQHSAPVFIATPFNRYTQQGKDLLIMRFS